MIDRDRTTYADGDAGSGLRYRFVGLCSETKPRERTTGIPLDAGCEFYESDTGYTYYWTGTNWQQKPLRADYQVTQSGQSSADLTRYFLILIREQRLTNTLLAQAQGVAPLFPPIPEIDSLAIA